jgi:L-2,4-diaminobutyric acid acetyltransferase
MLVCTYFRNTSIVYENSKEVRGFISGYLDPRTKNTLFIWQVALHTSSRGKGVALQMLRNLLNREDLDHIEYIETTISPSNKASQNLFHRLTSDLKAEINVKPYFAKELFGEEAHEDEELYRIGPLNNKKGEL